MANTIEYAKIFQQGLDKLAVQEGVTGWMDGNAGQVIYNGGDEIKIPILSTDGLADYSRENGYKDGDVTLRYQTHKMTQDRGRSFSLDAMDVDESNFVATASNVLGEFQRVQVTPEVDAYRLAKLAEAAIAEGNTSEYTIDEKTALKEFKNAIAKIRNLGYSGQLVAHVSYEFLTALELKFADQLTAITFSVGGADTTLPAIDKVALIETTSNKLVSKIDVDPDNGWKPATDAKEINFLLMAMTTPIGVNKLDLPRIFDPMINQDKNAWKIDYRRYHELFIKENQAKSIFASVKGIGA